MKGICHICRQITDVNYCDFCGHYMCDSCEHDYLSRGKEALKELLKKLSGKSEGFCCGPI